MLAASALALSLSGLLSFGTFSGIDWAAVPGSGIDWAKGQSGIDWALPGSGIDWAKGSSGIDWAGPAADASDLLG